MALTRGDVNATLKDLTIIAEDTVAQTRPTLVPLICHMMTEEGAYTKVPTPANLPFPQKFEAERGMRGKLVNAVQTYDQSTYELTIDLDSDLVKDAKAYDFASLVREATISAVLFPDYLLSTAVANGSAAASLAHDGNPFYGDTHLFAKAGANNIDNNLGATGTTISALFTDLGSAIAAIRGFKDNVGRLLNPVSAIGADNFVVQFPLSIEQNMRAVLNSETIPVPIKNVAGAENVAATTQGNTLRSCATPFPDGYLSGTAFYLHYIGMPRRPFVFIERYPIQVQVLGFGSEHEINNNAVRIALKHRFSLGYDRFDRSIKTS